jgi:hypothetical protein
MSKATESTPLITDPASIAVRYTAVWSEPDAHRRRSAIADLWADGSVEFVNGAQFRGREELDARISHAYTEFVESGTYTVGHADDATCHHDIVTFTIQLVSNSDGQVAWAARIFLLLDDAARIREDYQLTIQALPA